jgi:uncharacterized protein (TIGR00369 family)
MSDHLSEERSRYFRRDYTQGFIAHLGMTVVRVGKGRLEARVEVKPEFRQQDGFTHAGVITTLADHTAGYAAYTMIPEDHRILTVEYKINFLRPAFGEALVARSRVIKPGRKLLACESDVYDVRDANEVLCAKALLTMASVPSTDLAFGTPIGK